MKQHQTKSASETFTYHNVMEDRITHTVTEQENESIREKKKYEESTYSETKQEKEERQERAKIKETFEMESTTEMRSTRTVTIKKESFDYYVRETKKTTCIYENLHDYSSLDRFKEFYNERMGSKNVVKTPEQIWGMSSKTTYQVLSDNGENFTQNSKHKKQMSKVNSLTVALHKKKLRLEIKIYHATVDTLFLSYF